jgi:tRNA threonylcarbamoyladenosine biosynthesis protein TsaE
MWNLLTSGNSLLSSSSEETSAFGATLAAHLAPGTIVCLEGDLGTGKTTLAKGIIRTLTHLDESCIQSPTFIFLNLYPVSLYSLCHFDLYRMRSTQEFIDRGFLDYFDPHAISVIEWPCRIAELLPKEALCIHMSHVHDTERLITISAWGDRCL